MAELFYEDERPSPRRWITVAVISSGLSEQSLLFAEDGFLMDKEILGHFRDYVDGWDDDERDEIIELVDSKRIDKLFTVLSGKHQIYVEIEQRSMLCNGKTVEERLDHSE
jgi:hypothetical protein